MNSVNLTGRITRDPELKQKTNGDGSYMFFCLAVDGGKDKNSNKLTDFIDCIAYDKQAGFLSSYAKKGDLLEITGKIHTSEREDSEGNKIKRVTIIAYNVGILSSKKEQAAKPETAPATVDGKSLNEFKDSKEATPEEATALPFEI